jgi:hypothetical protein
MWTRNATEVGQVAANMLPGVTFAATNGTRDALLGMQADTLNSVGMLLGSHFHHGSILDF